MTQDWCSAVAGGVRLALQIQPNAKENGVIGRFGDVLKSRLRAQPIEGKANEALVAYLADTLDASKSALSVTHGTTTRCKIIEIKHRD